ncbi:ABC transporter substrate-binding protein [Aliikangiella sp. IMCC44359]|uniref:ABC transporter substrate-binding protein n=1 Tax=Aliikangiella sp. IMCC44359 TaxID=3459125 RepID=UPI00403AFB69
MSSFSLQAASNDLMRVGTTLWPGYEPIHLAEKLGYFNGHNIRTIDYPSTNEVLRAFKNHTLEVAALTLDEVVSLQEINLPLKIILVCDISYGGDVIVAKPSIGSVEQLTGKRVAVESTAVGAYILSRALQQNQLALSDIKIINMDVSMAVTALEKDMADAFVTYDPIKTKLINKGLKEIFSSKSIPGEVVDVLVVHQYYYDNYPKKLSILVKSWFHALDEMNKNPSKSYQYIAQRMRISSEEVAQSYKGLILPGIDKNHEMLKGKKPELKTTMLRLINIMQQINLLDKKPKISDIFTDEFLPKK